MISLTSDLSLFLDSFSLTVLMCHLSALRFFFLNILMVVSPIDEIPSLFLEYFSPSIWMVFSLYLDDLSLYPDGSYLHILIVRPSNTWDSVSLSLKIYLSTLMSLSILMVSVSIIRNFFSIPEYFSIMITYLYSIFWWFTSPLNDIPTLFYLSLSLCFPASVDFLGILPGSRLSDHTPKLHITIFIVKIILSSWF